MKATVEIPDELYRRVKAKSAIAGQPVREVVICLFRGWLADADAMPTDKPVLMQSQPVPAWFGALRKYAHRVNRHDLTSIRRSIAKGRAHASIPTSPEGRTR